MYTLPGIPSVYYGSEFGIEGQKQYGSDDSLRPAISYEEYVNATVKNDFTNLISRLGKIRVETKALSYGDYKELILTNGQYAFARNYNGESVLVTVNNSDDDFMMNIPCQGTEKYVGGLSGTNAAVKDGCISVNVKANSGEIWLPVCGTDKKIEPIKININEKTTQALAPEKTAEAIEPAAEENPVETETVSVLKHNKAFEEMTVKELQEAILDRMRRNGPVTEQMRKDVMENIYHGSLVTWIKSFN